MKSILKGAIIFCIGAGMGSFVTIALIKKKYEDKYNEELAALREHYIKKEEREEPEETVYETIVENEGYVSYDTIKQPEVTEIVKKVIDNFDESPPEDYPEEPFVIDESDFSEKELYFDKVEADYYVGDGALVDENEEMLIIDDSIGFENLEKFLSDESQDIMWIRNAELGVDYQVSKVSGKYSDIIGVGIDEYDED